MENEYIYEKYENGIIIRGFLGKYAEFPSEIKGRKVTAAGNLYYENKTDVITAKSVGITSKKTAYPFMEKLSVKNNISTLKCYAFCGSRNLEYAEIVCDALNAENGIFMDCTGLKTVILGEWSKNIPPYAFKGCCSLNKISFGIPPKKTGTSAFEKCVNLRNIDLSSLDFIGKRSFFGCMSIEKVILGKVTELSSLAFAECTSLSEFEIDECEKIGDDVFKGCYALSVVKLTAEKVDMGKLLSNVNKEIILAIKYPEKIIGISLPLQFSEYKRCFKATFFDFSEYDSISIRTKNIKAAFERIESNFCLSRECREKYISVLRDNISKSAEYALKNNKTDILFDSGAANEDNIHEIKKILGENKTYRAYLIEKSKEGQNKKYEL